MLIYLTRHRPSDDAIPLAVCHVRRVRLSHAEAFPSAFADAAAMTPVTAAAAVGLSSAAQSLGRVLGSTAAAQAISGVTPQSAGMSASVVAQRDDASTTNTRTSFARGAFATRTSSGPCGPKRHQLVTS